MPVKKSRNPFYVLLVPVGVAFVVTSFAYGIMAFQSVNGSAAGTATMRAHPLFQWMRLHGNAALMVELALLAALTIAAIGTDRWWDKPPKPDRFTPE